MHHHNARSMLIFFANRGPIRGGRELEREGVGEGGRTPISGVRFASLRRPLVELQTVSCDTKARPPVLLSHGSTEQLRSAANGLLKGHERARIKQPLDGRREGGDESRTAKAKIFSINGSDRIQWDISNLILRCCYTFVQQIRLLNVSLHLKVTSKSCCALVTLMKIQVGFFPGIVSALHICTKILHPA